MGFFDKKYCDVCGSKIGLLGNRKLENGNLCKECAAKLSPWFSERRKSTVEDIKQQLEYREENRQAVEEFHATRTLGRGCKVILDEDAERFMVTSARNYLEANPDVLEFSQVTGCDLDIDESCTEELREIKKADGKTERVSYRPQHFIYSYNFYIIIHVNTPYFDEIKFRLNSSDVEIVKTDGRRMEQIGTVGARNGLTATDIKMQNPDYCEYYNLGQEIKESLTNIRTQVREEIAEAAAPKMAMTCPWCGATTTVGAAGICEYCGGALNG